MSCLQTQSLAANPGKFLTKKQFPSGFLLLALMMLVFFAGSPLSQAFFSSDVEVFTDEERLLGFTQQKMKNKKHDDERMAGAPIIKKKRESWQNALDNSVADYKAWKSRQKKSIDESSPEYQQDLERKKKYYLKLESERLEYIKERNEKRAQKKKAVKLTEERELGLDEKWDPANFRKRALYFTVTKKKTGSGSGSGPSGSSDFTAPPGDFNPPNSMPPAPDFFEPEIPPPPPPPPPEFDDNIPPPIFDEAPPEF